YPAAELAAGLLLERHEEARTRHGGEQVQRRDRRILSRRQRVTGQGEEGVRRDTEQDQPRANRCERRQPGPQLSQSGPTARADSQHAANGTPTPYRPEPAHAAPFGRRRVVTG